MSAGEPVTKRAASTSLSGLPCCSTGALSKKREAHLVRSARYTRRPGARHSQSGGGSIANRRRSRTRSRRLGGQAPAEWGRNGSRVRRAPTSTLSRVKPSSLAYTVTIAGHPEHVEPFDHCFDRHGPEVVAVQEEEAVVDPIDRRKEPSARLVVRIRRERLDARLPTEHRSRRTSRCRRRDTRAVGGSDRTRRP